MDVPYVNAHLLRRYPISFGGTDENSATGSFVPQREHVTHADNSQDSWNFCNELRWYMSSENEDAEYDHGRLNCTFVMSTYQRNGTRVTVRLDGPLINWLVDKAGRGLKIRISLSHFGNALVTASGLAYKRTDQNNSCTSTADMSPTYPRKESNHPVFQDSFAWTPKEWLIDNTGNWSKLHEYHAKMDIMMFGIVKEGIVQQSQLTKVADPWIQLRNQIKEQFLKKKNTDMEIIAKGGKKFPCHKIVVIGESNKLAEMLAENSDDSGRMHSLILEESAASVTAFLACRYAMDDQEALQDCGICIDVFKITEKHELLGTQEFVKNILMTKFDCFSAGQCLQLYRYVHGKPFHKDLMEKALRAMKMKYQELLLSAEFSQLLGDRDQKSTVELLSALGSMSVVLTEAKYL